MVINTSQQCFCLLMYCSYCAAFVVESVWIVLRLNLISKLMYLNSLLFSLPTRPVVCFYLVLYHIWPSSAIDFLLLIINVLN